jgi:hypothetical protein
MRSKYPANSVHRLLDFTLLLAAVACGDDSSGPGRTDYSGTYPGQFYVIASSTTPSERDSVPGGPVTLSLARSGGDRYHFSATSTSGGSSADITIDQAGAVSFPSFVQETSLELISSLLFGICDLSNAVATPSGSVVDGRLTISVLATGGTCDWSAGLGDPDIRPTHLQLTWTGTKS